MRPLNQTFALLGRGIGDFIHKRPFCISFEITYSCNANCKHCHRGGTIEGEELAPPETFLQIAQELKPLVVQISGGEPLVRPDMEEIVRKIKNKNGTPVIIVTTNAGLLTREKYDSLPRSWSTLQCLHENRLPCFCRFLHFFRLSNRVLPPLPLPDPP